MAFQILNFPSIVASMINRVRGNTRRLTDFNVGSVVRTLLESVAAAVDELYQQMFNGLREAIPVATYNSFGFAKLAASAAPGQMLVTITSSDQPTLIGAGGVFTSDDARTSYVVLHDATIAPGETTGTVAVAAEATGVIGNLAAGVSFELTPRLPNFVSATNPQPFVGGRDVETEDERKQRFGDYITTLQRSTTAALETGARTVKLYNANGVEIERVSSASVVEPYVDDPEQPFSLVEVYVHNGVGSTSGALVAEARKILHGYVDDAGRKVPGWKAAGVKLVVEPALETALDVTAVLTPMPGYAGAALAAAAVSALQQYILDLGNGEAFVFSRAVVLVSSIEGVANIVFSAPTDDIPIDRKHKFMPGTIEVSPA